MLPQETSVRQLKKLRAETKGKDIGDLTKDDRLNHNVPNLQYIGNPIDTGIESWQEFCQKDSSVQTIAFKSKLVNKPIVKENKIENMKDIKKFEHFSEEDLIINARRDEDEEQEFFERPLEGEIEEIDELESDDDIFNEDDIINDEEEFENIKTFEDFDNEFDRKIDFDNFDNDPHRNDLIKIISMNSDLEIEELKNKDNEELEQLYYNLYHNEESVKTFEAFSVPAAKKEEKQPEYTLLGQEKEPKSNPNFGIGEVKAQEIKKITDFNLIDPPTPKERTIGGSAGVFIDNGTVKGFLNRIEGKDAYVESVDDPMVIKKFNLKDVVKTKKEE